MSAIHVLNGYGRRVLGGHYDLDEDGVRAVQRGLNALGFQVAVSGEEDGKTIAAEESFLWQRGHAGQRDDTDLLVSQLAVSLQQKGMDPCQVMYLGEGCGGSATPLASSEGEASPSSSSGISPWLPLAAVAAFLIWRS